MLNPQLGNDRMKGGTSHSNPRDKMHENATRDLRAKVESLEVDLILKTLKDLHGYDFTHYSRDSLLRRLQDFVHANELQNIAEIIPLLLRTPKFLDEFLPRLSIGVTEMFRDPEFFLSIRERVLPNLTTYPYVKIWHAGCSTGEEVYSNAILLDEYGLLDRSVIYGTDFNNQALDQAVSGVYSLKALKDYQKSYRAAGGQGSLSEYYHDSYENGIMHENLKRNVTFSHHNLVQDGVFGEMTLILCRNVLIYFDLDLQNQVLKLLTDSLRPGGYLCLGRNESLNSRGSDTGYEIIDRTNKIYRKVVY